MGTKDRAPRGAAQAFVEQACAYEGDDCLIWPYGLGNRGYGRVHVRVDGKLRATYAHRVVLEKTQGPAPDPDMVAAHTPVICHNPPCVNPRHLRWATHRENALDRRLDGTMFSLSRDDVEFIRLYETRVKPAALAHMFSVSVDHVRAIQRGTAYENITINGRVTFPHQRWKDSDELQDGPDRPWPPKVRRR